MDNAMLPVPSDDQPPPNLPDYLSALSGELVNQIYEFALRNFNNLNIPKKIKEDISQHREEEPQRREEGSQHREDEPQHREDESQHREEEPQHREEESQQTVYLGRGSPWRAGWREPSLLRVCKRFRQEAMPMYYKLNDIQVTVQTHEFGRLIKWLESVVGENNANLPFKSLEIMIYQRHDAWEDVKNLFPLAEFFYKFDAKLAEDSKIPDSRSVGKTLPYVKVQYCPGMMRGPMRTFLGQCVKLGSRARVKGWSLEKLKTEYNRRVTKKMSSKAYAYYLKKKELQDMRTKGSKLQQGEVETQAPNTA